MPADPAETPQVVKIAEGFHVRLAVDNIAWMDLGDYALAVDALEQTYLAREVFDAIEATIGDKPVRYMLNTHPHGDHTALNAAFQERYGTEIVNARTTKIAPDGRWFEGTRRRALMLPMGGCHTPEDCLVWVPADKALFVGDIFGWGLIPLSDPLNDKTARLLVDTYNRMIDFGAAVVIPGHGPLAETATLQRWVEYFHWLIDTVARAVAAGKSDRQIAGEAPPPKDMLGWWRFVQWKHADSLGKVVQAVRGKRLKA